MRFINPAVILMWCMTTLSVALLNTVISLGYIGVPVQKLETTLGPDSALVLNIECITRILAESPSF